jgi:hypothetical protein
LADIGKCAGGRNAGDGPKDKREVELFLPRPWYQCFFIKRLGDGCEVCVSFKLKNGWDEAGVKGGTLFHDRSWRGFMGSRLAIGDERKFGFADEQNFNIRRVY